MEIGLKKERKKERNLTSYANTTLRLIVDTVNFVAFSPIYNVIILNETR